MSLKAHHQTEPQFRELNQNNTYYLINTGAVLNGSPELFEQAKQSGHANLLGRGTAFMFEYLGLELVLRHCLRGGLIRHISKDTYLFTGLKRTRMWRELNLLAQMRAEGLPVPVPVAARCTTVCGLFYKGDLVTQRIPKALTLMEILQRDGLGTPIWQLIGEVIARFHAYGIYHADLNANNIMLDQDNRVYLIDFDKAAKKIGATVWQQGNLQRLQRSLDKQKRLNKVFHYDKNHWYALCEAYQRQMQFTSE